MKKASKVVKADSKNLRQAPFQYGNNQGRPSTNDMMRLVILACLPAIVVSTLFFGYGLLINLLLCSSTALCAESLVCRLRGWPVQPRLSDGSALVTAVLLGIALPIGCEWWMPVTSTLFAILLIKHCFGGLGYNLFNPAAAAYVALLLSYPLEMTTWYLPQKPEDLATESLLGLDALLQSLKFSFPQLASNTTDLLSGFDGMAMATPLIEFKMSGNSAVLAALDEGRAVFSRAAGTGWELINVSFLLGGLFLIFKRVITWHIPVSIIATVLLLSVAFYESGSSNIFGLPSLHLFGTATMIGAFFIATDPVSAATTQRGKLVYGVLIGVSIYSIRVWGSYLDSVALSILFGNCCAPLIDHYCRPRIHGHRLDRPLHD